MRATHADHRTLLFMATPRSYVLTLWAGSAGLLSGCGKGGRERCRDAVGWCGDLWVPSEVSADKEDCISKHPHVRSGQSKGHQQPASCKRPLGIKHGHDDTPILLGVGGGSCRLSLRPRPDVSHVATLANCIHKALSVITPPRPPGGWPPEIMDKTPQLLF